jgi:hypothetical protein
MLTTVFQHTYNSYLTDLEKQKGPWGCAQREAQMAAGDWFNEIHAVVKILADEDDGSLRRGGGMRSGVLGVVSCAYACAHARGVSGAVWLSVAWCGMVWCGVRWCEVV